MPSPIAAPADLSIAKDVVLAFIDIQRGIADNRLTLRGRDLRRNVESLAKLAKTFSLPTLVIGVAQPEKPEPEIFEEITDELGPQPVLVRNVPNALNDAEIRAALEATGKKTLVISGVYTEIAVALPALTAVREGYDVQVVVDACGGSNERNEDAILRRLTQAGVRTTTLMTLSAELAGGFSSSEGQRAMQILFDVASRA